MRVTIKIIFEDGRESVKVTAARTSELLHYIVKRTAQGVARALCLAQKQKHSIKALTSWVSSVHGIM